MEFIYEKDNFLTPHFCNNLIKRYDAVENKNMGVTVGGYNPDVKITTDISLFREGSFWQESLYINNKIRGAVGDYLWNLIEKDIDKYNEIRHPFNNFHLANPRLQKMDTGGFYRWHHDARSANSRLLTYLIYLNDVEEGCGGTTDFYTGKSIRPKIGKLVIFPSTWTYLHRGKKVEKGEKYVVTGFVWSKASLDD
jgi:hypothetical protein